MSTAPHSSMQQHTRRLHFTADIQQIERYFAALPASADGCIEIGLGKPCRDDPAKIDVYPPKPAWGEGQRFRWYSPETRTQLAQDIARLIEKCRNVYISRAIYQSPERKADAAQPSRVLVFDDVTPNSIYSLLVETSPSNYQGYIFLSEDADAATVRELTERGAKALAGTKNGHADSCYDVTRLVRIPGSYNTKHGRAFPVHIAAHTGTTYSVAELRAMWPEVEHSTAIPTDLAWPEVEHCLANIDGITKRIKTTSPTYKYLHSDGFALGGPGEGGRSKLRWAVACNLRNKFGYPDEEIAAILWHFNWGHLQEKGTAWLQKDIENCITQAHAQYPNVDTKPSYCRLDYQKSKPAQPLPQVERKQRGRPAQLTPDRYYKGLQELATHSAMGIIVPQNQQELADHFKVSVITIRRYEKQLATDGRLERCTVRKRGGTHSYVKLFSTIKNSSQIDIKNSQAASLVLSPEAPEAQPHAENNAPPVVVESTHRADRVSSEPQPSPSEAVAWAFTVLRARDQRVTLKRVRDWITEQVPGADWSERQITSAYRVHRKHEEREYSAGYWEGLRAMNVAELQRAIESIDQRLHNPPKRPRLTPAQLRTRRQHLRMVLDQKIAAAKRAPTPSGGACFPQQPENVVQPGMVGTCDRDRLLQEIRGLMVRVPAERLAAVAGQTGILRQMGYAELEQTYRLLVQG